MTVKLFISIFLVLSFTLAKAQISSVEPRDLKCSKDGTVILYVPGQENTIDDIENSRARLEELFSIVDRKYLIDKPGDTQTKPKVIFKALKNETFGFVEGTAIVDFAKSIALIFQTELNYSRDKSWAVAYQYFSQALTNKYIDSEGKEISISPQTRDLLANEHRTVLQQLIEIEDQITNDLKNIVLATIEKKKLIIVSHSQGNLFVNAAVQELKSNTSFTEKLPFIGNLQIASPAQHIEIDKSLHVTNSMDSILKLNILSYTPLLPNFFLIRPIPDYRDISDQDNNHGLLTTYLRGQELGDFAIDPGNGNMGQLKELVVQSIVDVAAKLKSNCEAQGCDGAPGSSPQANVFVANTAYLAESVYIPFAQSFEICENAKVFGNVTIGGYKLKISGNAVVHGNAYINGFGGGLEIKGNAEVMGQVSSSLEPLVVTGFTKIYEGANIYGGGIIDGTTEIGSSEVNLGKTYLNDSQIFSSKVYLESNVSSSTIINSTVKASHVGGSTIKNSKLDASDVGDSTIENSVVEASSVGSSTIKNSTIKASFVYGSTVESSTLDIGAGVDFSTVRNSTINDSSIHESTIENSTLTEGSYVFNSNFSNFSCSEAYIMNNSKQAGTCSLGSSPPSPPLLP